jgi:DNA polymerase-3 subunit epsilon
MYAIVDIETTGGYAAAHRITEVAVHFFDGSRVTEKFHSLVNPGMRIPAGITALTGITNEMVATAPSFSEIAGKLHSLLHERVFVAHNVNFDYSFLKNEFEQAGLGYSPRKLCTVRLARKIIPGMPSYSLGNICSNLGIKINDRHRADGDVEATVKLFKIILERDEKQFIKQSLKKNSREYILPPHLPREQFMSLPEAAGIYYFHDRDGKVIYVGKAKNIRKRVSSHFTGHYGSRKKHDFIDFIHRVSFEQTGNELVAMLLESQEIKSQWPRFNKSQKGPDIRYGIYTYEDRRGFLRLCINKVSKTLKPLFTFRMIAEARMFIEERAELSGLCSRICGLQISCNTTDTGTCVCCDENGAPESNLKLKNSLVKWEEELESFLLIGEGRKKNEVSVVMMEKGRYQGFGFMDQPLPTGKELIKSSLKPGRDTPDSRSIIYSWIRNNPSENILSF